jgi:predicted dehydrogenase
MRSERVRFISVALLLVAVLVAIVPAFSAGRMVVEQRFRIAIVGLVHSHAWGHLRSMAKMTQIEFVGIAEPNADLRNLAAKEAPGVALFEDYHKLLDEAKPEGVWAFVENDRHLELTRECAARGIHVIFEKPMAASYDQAVQMLDIARKHKIKLMINYQMAWWPNNYAAFNLAKSGELGKIWRVRSVIGHGGPAPSSPSDVRNQRFWDWLNDEKRGGGALMDFTGYGAVWLRWYLGMPTTVYAITTHTRPDVYRSNTNATVLASFPDNGVGIIEGSWDLPRSFQDVEVFGNKGSVYMTSSKIEAYVGRERKEVTAEALDENHSNPVPYFVYAVRGDKPMEGMVSPEFNVDVMQIVEAAQRSARSGQPVKLPLR